MCSVQVVLFAEVMGRSTGRPRGVCRRLFSDAPAAPNEKADPGHFLRAMEVELRRRDTERWNFDFQKERPLPGRYQWVAVGAKIEEKSTEVEKETTTEVEIVDEVVAPPQRKDSSSIPECKRRKSNSAGAATQAKITDFLRKRKRTDPEESKSLKMRRLSSNLPANLASTTARPT